MADLILNRHQSQLVYSPWHYKDIEFFFLIGGFGCGKSMGDVALILNIARKYNGHPVSVAVCSTTQTLFRKTIWMDLVKILKINNIKYSFNQQDNIFIIGTVYFLVVATENPSNIYGPNVSIVIFDEADELPQDKAILAFVALSERCRVPLPDNRRPFMVTTTTAQGMRGCYQFTESLKEKGVPFIIIRGHTNLNVYLDPAFYERQYALYNEQERRAYLFGEFVNLQSGRVYPEYDESLHTVDDLEIFPDDEIHVGCDLNIAACCATAIVKRNGILHTVREWQFKNFGRAAEIIRAQYPTNNIILHPDATGKLIISGYLASFEQQGITVKMGNVNPPILERIFLLNKGLALGLVRRCKSCKNLDMAWKTRVYADNQMPEKSKKHPSADDACDGVEYGLADIFANDLDYFSLYSITRTYKVSN
jgi:hypothetical protein